MALTSETISPSTTPPDEAQPAAALPKKLLSISITLLPKSLPPAAKKPSVLLPATVRESSVTAHAARIAPPVSRLPPFALR